MKKLKKLLVSPKIAFNSGKLSKALKASGDYVYAYYGRPEAPLSAFYVGKGKGGRALQHWEAAASTKPDKELKPQERVIREILRMGRLPVVKLLAYNLENTKRAAVYSVVERVIQDAFGIQKVWEKRPGIKDRRIDIPVSSLVQIREDSSNTPIQALESLIGLKCVTTAVQKNALPQTARGPVLLVGLSKTFHPSYSPTQLAEMARMYWNLARFRNTSFPLLEEHDNAALLAWASLSGKPTIVGAWRIVPNSFQANEFGRFSCAVNDDLELRRNFIGVCLKGTGNKYQGPQIIHMSTTS